MSSHPPDLSSQRPPACERMIVWTLCLLGVVHVIVYSAAFPFFNPSDEQSHFDTIIQYFHGRLPRKLDLMTDESMSYVRVYFSPEYIYGFDFFADGQYPPPPWMPLAGTNPAPSDPGLMSGAQWRRLMLDKPPTMNYEASQQPLYYAIAGGWWKLGKVCRFSDGFQLYWARFLNALFIGALIWISYLAAKLVFPTTPALRFAVPALIAAMPQTAFYSLSNDMLSAVCFGIAFIFLIRLWRSETPDIKLSLATGSCAALTFLVKNSNLPFLAVVGICFLIAIGKWLKNGARYKVAQAGLAFGLSAGVPILGWMAWCKITFGDFAGSALKTQILGWTLKPFPEWWHHPIFSGAGAWSFISGLLVTFWQGEFSWHGLGQPLNLPVVNALYVIPTLALIGLAVMGLVKTRRTAGQSGHDVLWLCLLCLVAGVAFLGFLSIIYDFGECQHPSREDPYFNHGRLMLGALVPFMLLLVYGIHYMLRDVKNKWLLPLVFTGMILFMLIAEAVTCWSVFQSQYNFYHL